jgi:hypothetical protein
VDECEPAGHVDHYIKTMSIDFISGKKNHPLKDGFGQPELSLVRTFCLELPS